MPTRKAGLSALQLSQPRSGCVPSAGQDGPLLYPGPLCGGETGSTGRAAGVDKDVDSFSPGQDALSKSPAPAHGLAGQEPGKRQAGWPSLLVTFLLATQEKSNSAAAGRRKFLAPDTAKAPCAAARRSRQATKQLPMSHIQRGRPPLGGRPRMTHRGSYSPAFSALTMPLPNPLA